MTVQHHEEFRLTHSPTPDFVAVVRFAAGMVATRSNFDVDEVQDLQLAVDELYALSGILETGRSAECVVSRRGFDVTVELRTQFHSSANAPSLSDGVSPQRELSQQLLTALVSAYGEVADSDGLPRVWLRMSHAK